MSILGWGEKPKPQVKAVPVEKDDTEEWLASITRKAVQKGAVLDARTKEEIVKENMTHANAGRSWADAHRFQTDEQLAAEQSRLTVRQQLNRERFKHYVAVKEEQMKRP